ncbi:Fungalysin/Thermolysin Extracellular metalloproteinase 5, partial [Ceratobasidium sp. 392]
MGTSRCTFPLAILSSVTLAAAHAHGGARRSLAFRQSLPNLRFIVDPPPISAYDVHDSVLDPNVVARRFIEEHILGGVFDYYIRNDSYTDQNTGVSHIYTRQIANGIEVADADMNLNIRDGRVLSYGSSVFSGQFPEDVLNQTGWSQETYCTDIPPGGDLFACDVSLDRIRTAAAIYPNIINAKDRSPILAIYFFVIAANPNISPSNIHIDRIIATPQTCQNTVSTSCWAISPLQSVLSPIQARLVYVQTHAPGSSHTQLNLAWRLEVEMKENYYEA